jgi:hypothetical protein
MQNRPTASHRLYDFRQFKPTYQKRMHPGELETGITGEGATKHAIEHTFQSGNELGSVSPFLVLRNFSVTRERGAEDRH